MSRQPDYDPKQDAGAPFRRQRLLSDIKELVEKPYPNITLHIANDDLTQACLILNPPNYKPLHLTIFFSIWYPMHPPTILMNSDVIHPNVFGNFICASILRRDDEHTPAYTLKGIAIQMLSFFSSESLEQDYGGKKDLADHRSRDKHLCDSFRCGRCNFGESNAPFSRPVGAAPRTYDARVSTDPSQWPTLQGGTEPSIRDQTQEIPVDSVAIRPGQPTIRGIQHLPNELILLILEPLEFEDLTHFAAAWSRISDIVRDFDLVRQRELQCFCLKQDYQSVKLGVGVSIVRGHIASEFDLLSQEAFRHWQIRAAVNGLKFQHWLPLPITRQHWHSVKSHVEVALRAMKPEVKSVGPFSEAQVLFTFMNDVVVRLNKVSVHAESHYSSKTNLRHASEKAIDSYFHLFHLLVCLATEDHSLVEHSNSLLRKFMSGKQSKVDCPNLGHLLIALLISDVEVTPGLIRSIITEAITRNVVWLFDQKGADKPELSYMEQDPVSAYRLNETFQGSRTSYRLLMFSELFRRTARPSHNKPLTQVRDELFDRRGAPPRNAAQELSQAIRRLHTIDNFPAFLREMGLPKIPDPRTFTDILRKTVLSSMKKGYSVWGMPVKRALLLRVAKDPDMKVRGKDAEWIKENSSTYHYNRRYSFFPNRRGQQDNNSRRSH